MIRFLVMWLTVAGTAFAGSPVKVLIVTGGHDHEPSFYALFDDERFAARVDPHPSAFTNDFRQSTDVLVLYDMVPDMREEQKRNNLLAFVEAGKGIVVLHHAIGDHNAWRWWYEDVVGGRYLFKAEGSAPASTFKHDERIGVKVTRQHPVTDGLTGFTIEDETYKGMWISPKVQVLLTTDNPTSDGPLAWLGLHPKARVVYVQLGHGRSAYRDPNFQRLVRNAIFWAGNR